MAKKLAAKQAWEVLVHGGRDEWTWTVRDVATDRETAEYILSEKVAKYAAEYDNQAEAWVGMDGKDGEEVEIRLQETVIYSLIH